MPWRVIALGDQVWHVDALAERPANTEAWQLVLSFRSARTALLDPVSAGGGLEVVAVHPGGAHPRHRSLAAPGRAAGVSSLELQDLRRIVAAVARLRGEAVREVTVRSDLRQLRVELASGLILVVSAERDEQGRPRLAVDVVEVPHDTTARQQIEVRFD